MPGMGFEPTIPAFERAKVFHTSDRAATVVGSDGIFRNVDGRISRADKRSWIRFIQQRLFAVDNIPFNHFSTLLSVDGVAV
jgi:hypothetical protein